MHTSNQQPETVTEKYSDQWIAWDEADQHIVATGRTYDEAKQNAISLGINSPIIEKIPPADAAFVGGL